MKFPNAFLWKNDDCIVVWLLWVLLSHIGTVLHLYNVYLCSTSNYDMITANNGLIESRMCWECQEIGHTLISTAIKLVYNIYNTHWLELVHQWIVAFFLKIQVDVDLILQCVLQEQKKLHLKSYTYAVTIRHIIVCNA